MGSQIMLVCALAVALFSVSAAKSVVDHDREKRQTTTATCDLQFYQTSGQIDSSSCSRSGLGGPYYDNAYYRFRIWTTEDPTYCSQVQVQTNIQVLDIESPDQLGTNCPWDYVEVVGSTGRSCGANKWVNTTTSVSWGSSLEIRFISDSSVSRRGFIVYYSIRNPCSGSNTTGYPYYYNTTSYPYYYNTTSYPYYYNTTSYPYYYNTTSYPYYYNTTSYPYYYNTTSYPYYYNTTSYPYYYNTTSYPYYYNTSYPYYYSTTSYPYYYNTTNYPYYYTSYPYYYNTTSYPYYTSSVPNYTYQAIQSLRNILESLRANATMLINQLYSMQNDIQNAGYYLTTIEMNLPGK